MRLDVIGSHIEQVSSFQISFDVGLQLKFLRIMRR